MEPVKTRHPQLLYESKLYKILQGGTGIPHVRHVCDVHVLLVILPVTNRLLSLKHPWKENQWDDVCFTSIIQLIGCIAPHIRKLL